MGFPMIQVVMIAARQISKPIADAVISYGKDHPTFRTKMLIPVGRSIVHLTTRLRMKGLGLGEVVPKVQVSEAAALEQASDFVQQVVIFSYSVAIFAGYYFYSKFTAEETAKMDDLRKLEEMLMELKKTTETRFEEMQQLLNSLPLRNNSPIQTTLNKKDNLEKSVQETHVEPRVNKQLNLSSPPETFENYELPYDDPLLIFLTGSV